MDRLFIAINLGKILKDQLSTVLEDLKKEESSIKWVESWNLHITLKFLGDTHEDKIKNLKKALKDIVLKHQTFSFKLKEPGCFPHTKNPRIVWIGISEGKDNLLNLNRDLDMELENIGFPKENKEFKCHITLGRVKKFKKIYSIERLLEKIKIKDFVEQKVENIDLIKSNLYPEGPVYEVIEQYALAK